jgi:hypothetical protein
MQESRKISWSSRQCVLTGTLVLLLGSICRPTALLAAQEGLSDEEKETLQQAKDPEQQLKLWLGIAENRLKEIVLSTRKLDKDATSKAAAGFRTAVTSADDCVAKEQGGKNYKKLLLQLHKAMKKYNFALLQALDKAAEQFRQYIQLAFEASQRVQDAAEIQMAHVK